MKSYILFLFIGASIAFSHVFANESSFSSNSISVVNSELKDVKKISNALRKKYDPGDVVTKYVEWGGMYIFAREDVSDYALLEARYILKNMFELNNSLIRNKLKPIKAFIRIWAIRELSGDIMDMPPGPERDFWDKRARGFGGTRDCTAGEEGLLCSAGNPYGGEGNSPNHLSTQSENIFIHEFAHQIHRNLDKEDCKDITEAYQAALKNPEAKEFIAKYGMSNESEYFAVCTQIWFEASWHRASLTFLRHPRLKPDITDPFLCRNTLIKSDPNISKVLTKVFGLTDWRFTDPRTRYSKLHFVGYDPSKSLPFTFDRKIVDEYNDNYKKGLLSKKSTLDDKDVNISQIPILNKSKNQKNVNLIASERRNKNQVSTINNFRASSIKKSASPHQVIITTKVNVSLFILGKEKGVITLNEGYQLNVIRTEKSNLIAKIGEGEFRVPKINTNYDQLSFSNP